MNTKAIEDRLNSLEREQYIYHPFFKNELGSLQKQIDHIRDWRTLPIWEIVRLKIKWWIIKD